MLLINPAAAKTSVYHGSTRPCSLRRQAMSTHIIDNVG